MADAVLLVCGGRDYTDRNRLWATLDEFRRARGIARVIAGGARGADTLAADWAEAHGLPCEVLMANWAELGRNAGPIPNQHMLDEERPTQEVASLVRNSDDLERLYRLLPRSSGCGRSEPFPMDHEQCGAHRRVRRSRRQFSTRCSRDRPPVPIVNRRDPRALRSARHESNAAARAGGAC